MAARFRLVNYYNLPRRNQSNIQIQWNLLSLESGEWALARWSVLKRFRSQRKARRGMENWRMWRPWSSEQIHEISNLFVKKHNTVQMGQTAKQFLPIHQVILIGSCSLRHVVDLSSTRQLLKILELTWLEITWRTPEVRRQTCEEPWSLDMCWRISAFLLRWKW